MRGFTFRALLARGRRATLTALVVMAGVATITGTLVFTDTIHHAYRQLFAGGARGADLVITGRQRITTDPSDGVTIPDSLVAKIRQLPGVVAAAGQVSDLASIVGRNGHVIKEGRLPTAALSYLPAPFTGIKIVRGTPPVGLGEVAIDAQTARRQGYRIGDTVSILTDQPVRHFRITGIAQLGDQNPGGEAFAVFGLDAAHVLFSKAHSVDLAYLRLIGPDARALVTTELSYLLPPQLIVRTAGGQADADTQRVSARLRSLTSGLLAFALVAVIVGVLLIFNTFSITATQRSGELALLRALGATRLQVLGTVMTEALIIGLAGAVIGIGLGPVAALVIRALFDAAGVGLPAGGIVLRSRTVLVGLGAGVGSALLAALIPALRATRSAPLEALRVASVPPRRRSRLLGPLLVAPVARVVTPLLERRGSLVAGLAGEQAVQSPLRVAVSASPLTIGLALIILVTVYAGGLRAATRNAVHQTFAGDIAIENQDGTSPIPATSVQAATSIPGLVSISSDRTAQADLGSAGSVQVNGVEPTTWGQVYRFSWVHGSTATLAGLTTGQVLVEADTAKAAHLRVGESTRLVTGSGQTLAVTVSGIYRDAGLLRGVTVDSDWFAQLFNQPRLRAVFVKLGPGASEAAALASLRASLAPFPGVVARSPSELAGKAQSEVASVVGLFYALLALSLLMSLIGIAGTLNLSVHERTRELGMLRALGLTAQQARELIRCESIISAGVGALTGLVLGIALSFAVADVLSPEGFVLSVPWLALIAVLLAGLIAGIVSGLPPARRAARLDILAAIAHE